MFRPVAAQEEDIPSFVGEVQRRDETKGSSDMTPLLNKLISDMEDMKGQILSEMPEQLEKQSEEMKKMADDIKNAKELIMAHASKTDSSVAKLSQNLDDVKNKQAEETKNNQQHLTTIETVADATKEISQSLRFHDQRLQNLSIQGKSQLPMKN